MQTMKQVAFFPRQLLVVNSNYFSMYFQDFIQRSSNNKEAMSADAKLLVPIYIAPLQREK